MIRNARLFLAASVAAGLLISAGSAFAADRSATLDSTATTFAWDSKLGTGFTTLTDVHDRIPCGTPVVHDCDFTLLHVVGKGSVLLQTTSDAPNAVDSDLYAYLSDSSGTQGAQLGFSAAETPTPNEQLVIDSFGDEWFLVEIDYTDNIGGTIKGTATFTPSPTP